MAEAQALRDESCGQSRTSRSCFEGSCQRDPDNPLKSTENLIEFTLKGCSSKVPDPQKLTSGDHPSFDY